MFGCFAGAGRGGGAIVLGFGEGSFRGEAGTEFKSGAIALGFIIVLAVG